MRKYDLITPEGTKDFLFEECLVRREIEQDLHDLFRSKGYSELTTPGLEFFDVFQSESGHSRGIPFRLYQYSLDL